MIGRSTSFCLCMLALTISLQPAMAVERDTSSSRMRVPSAPAQPVTVAVTAADYEIVDYLVPKTMFLEGNRHGFRISFNASLERNTASMAMLAANPGLADVLRSATETKLMSILEAEYPALRDEVAAVVARTLKSGDYPVTTKFLRSSAASKQISSVYGQKTQERAAGQFAGRPSSEALEIKAQDAAALEAAAQRDALSQMTQEEIRSIAEFGVTPAGRRFATVQKAFSETSLAWVNRLMARRMADVNEAGMLAAQKYFQEKK